jgi:hypothetical protein
LHYLSTSENKWARCPICFDSVNEFQLKSVKWYEGSTHAEEELAQPSASSSSSTLAEDSFEINPKAGSLLRMRLIQRPQITTLALPRSSTWPSDLLPPHQAPFHFLPDIYEFSKFMLATPDYLITDLSKDLDELAMEKRVLAGMNDSLGVTFIDSAELKIRNQIEKASALETPGLKNQIERARRDHREMQERIAMYGGCNQTDATKDVEEVPEDFLALRSNQPPNKSTGLMAKPQQGQIRNGPRQRRNVNPPAPVSDYYYYQAASGLPLFLHPLDIRILLSHYSRYSAFPDTITVKVEASAEGSVNDDLRKRCKYLGHFPEGADVVFVEADLSGVVGTEGLKSFEGPLRLRANKRKEKERKDDRARARAEEREREKEKSAVARTQHHYGGTHPDFSSSFDDHSAFLISADDYAHASPPLPETTPLPAAPAPAPIPTSGAWGTRSFASALHSTASSNPRSSVARREREADEWDVDAAWHELERNAGGRKKRGARMVVLGSGGGGARRR